MNENKRNRRRFLAEILFAGTAATGAAFLAQSVQSKTPDPLASASPKPPKYQAVPGQMVPPRVPPPPEPKLGGEPVAPRPTPPPTPQPTK